MMAPVQPFYLADGPDRYLATASTSGPWSPRAQHGGPPAALLARAVQALGRDGAQLGRFTLELLGPVPVGPLEVTASVVRPGRSVQLVEATLHDADLGRPCARATAWLFPAGHDGPAAPPDPPGHSPADGEHKDFPPSWSTDGYLAATEWRWVSGSVSEPGPGVVWMRPRVDLVEGEPTSAVQRLLACADSASGVSATLDPAAWTFVNTELTVHVLREPEGDWVCLDAETVLGPGRVALAASRVYDARGLVARTAQALLVTPR